MADRERRRVELTGEGPVLVYGPVEVVTADGRHISSDRAVTALCACRRSRRYPFCDTSHRSRARHRRAEESDAQHTTGGHRRTGQ